MAIKTVPSEPMIGGLSVEERRQSLARVLSSKHFTNAPMKQRFLRLICEFHINGRGAELNEYLIGQEVFGRSQTYNPATDPIVRVGAHGIREKLQLYYQTEGAEDPVRIEIPLGSYEPVFVRPPMLREIPRSEEVADENGMEPSEDAQYGGTAKTPPPSPAPRPAAKHERWIRALSAALLGMGVLVIVLLILVQRLRGERSVEIEKTRSNAGPVWAPFLRSNDPTLVVLSNPAVLRPMNTADPEALSQMSLPLSPAQANLISNAAGNRLPLRPGQPMQLIPAFTTYTGIGEAIGVYRLSNLLHGMGETTILKQSRSINPHDLKNYDVILLGSVYANQWSKPLSIKENFVYSSRSTIVNESPHPGEEPEYRASFHPQTNALIEDHAVITLVPSVLGDKTIMVIAGIYSEGTEAAAEFVTDLNHLHEIDRALRKMSGAGQPARYFQALLKVRVENAFPTRTTLVAVRPLEASEQ